MQKYRFQMLMYNTNALSYYFLSSATPSNQQAYFPLSNIHLLHQVQSNRVFQQLFGHWQALVAVAGRCNSRRPGREGWLGLKSLGKWKSTICATAGPHRKKSRWWTVRLQKYTCLSILTPLSKIILKLHSQMCAMCQIIFSMKNVWQFYESLRHLRMIRSNAIRNMTLFTAERSNPQ